MLPVFLPMLRTLLTGHSVHSVQDPPLVPPQGTHHQKPRSRSFPYSSWKWAIQLSTLAHRPPRGSEIAGCLVRGSEVWFWLVFDVFFKWNLFYIPPKKIGGGGNDENFDFEEHIGWLNHQLASSVNYHPLRSWETCVQWFTTCVGWAWLSKLKCNVIGFPVGLKKGGELETL